MQDGKVKNPVPPMAAIDLRNEPHSAHSADKEQAGAPAPPVKSGLQDDTRSAPYLSELPAQMKKALPSIHITSHLYRGNSRLVSINGRIMSQGVSMDDGLFLEEITPEGVILSFRGHRFRVRAD
jgi:general secretion pathway protein B